ncbi:MAG: DUF4962 domain-containing protein [Fidelibacterota bacterium]|nr:MAG: DUF4962 domain-containing protein [Candidatus Neomarinimicrobiota bacterium]
MKRIGLRMIALLLLSGIATSSCAQQDTLSWDYVINRGWSRPARLDSLATVHPRMLLDSARIEILKVKISSTHQFIWSGIQGKADSYLSLSPRENPTSEDDTRWDGDAVPWLAMAYLLTEDSKYLDKAASWMTKVCGYNTWDGNHSLGAAHCLMGISLGYDWLYHDLTPSQQTTIRDGLAYFANAMTGGPTHKERYLSNHCQVEYTGLGAAGFALYGDVDSAEDWIRQAYNIFDTAYKISGDDGSSTEGHQYFGLMTEFQMHFNKMAKEVLGINFYKQSEWLENMGYFILYCTLPDFTADNCVMRYGDTRNYTYVSHGPTYQLLNLASEYRNPHFQWLAMDMFGRDIGVTDRMGWANLLWYDETIPTVPPDSLPTFKHFEDTDWITSRSSWNRDDAVMIGFKCGPFHGHAIQALYDSMSTFHHLVNGHGHPDVNHFNIYAYGKWLVRDDGRSTPKHTHYHNTVIVNGYGQLGEWTPEVGSNWFDRDAVFDAGATSRIIRAESDSTLDYLIGDAENIYRPEAGLTRFQRHFVFLKPDVIIILDELEAERPSKFEWLLHTDGSVSKVEAGKFLITQGDVVMDVQFLLPAATADDNSTQLLKVYPAENVEKTLILAVMHPRKTADVPAEFNLVSPDDSTLTIEVSVGEEQRSVTLELIGWDSPVGISDPPAGNSPAPEKFSLYQNYPNPFNPSTIINYSVAYPGLVQLLVYDVSGQLVRTLVTGNMLAGDYSIVWDGRDRAGRPVSSGLYFYALKGGHNTVISKRSILQK